MKLTKARKVQLKMILGYTSQTTEVGEVSKTLAKNNLAILSKPELEKLITEVQGKSGSAVRDKIAQKRPRCFQSDKVVKLYGKYLGPLTKNQKNGEGLFLW